MLEIKLRESRHVCRDPSNINIAASQEEQLTSRQSLQNILLKSCVSENSNTDST